jgi:hypothetical protein
MKLFAYILAYFSETFYEYQPNNNNDLTGVQQKDLEFLKIQMKAKEEKLN